MSDGTPPSQPRIITRRRFLAGLGAAALGGAGLYGYAYGPGRHHVGVVEHDVYIPDLPAAFNGFTITQMSDFHFGPFDETAIVDDAVEIVNELRSRTHNALSVFPTPAITVLTGDFITADHQNNQNNLDAAARAAIALSRIEGPKFASLGNHDTIDLQGVTNALESRGIKVLRNDRLPFDDGGGNRIWLAGVADICLDLPDPLKTLPEYAPNEPVILLGHAPDYADDIVKIAKGYHRRCDLMLCGHTHGGQINLPLVTRGMLPEWGRKYIHGPFQIGSTLLYVNRGLGTIHLPVRFNAPPEITVFHLHNGTQKKPA